MIIEFPFFRQKSGSEGDQNFSQGAQPVNLSQWNPMLDAYSSKAFNSYFKPTLTADYLEKYQSLEGYVTSYIFKCFNLLVMSYVPFLRYCYDNIIIYRIFTTCFILMRFRTECVISRIKIRTSRTFN